MRASPRESQAKVKRKSSESQCSSENSNRLERSPLPLLLSFPQYALRSFAEDHAIRSSFEGWQSARSTTALELVDVQRRSSCSVTAGRPRALSEASKTAERVWKRYRLRVLLTCAAHE